MATQDERSDKTAQPGDSGRQQLCKPSHAGERPVVPTLLSIQKAVSGMASRSLATSHANTPVAESHFWINPVKHDQAPPSAFGICVKRVHVVRKTMDRPPHECPVEFEGLALIDQNGRRLLRLFVVRPFDHCLLEWPLEKSPIPQGDGPPIYRSRTLRPFDEEGP